ncbi:aspartic peptidase domain-containing protein [Podospora aff. communis PSN243]|uniref:Aspartic peptidase domain-containing protein n=1 Tax=Podospora aff. communis PSN243 TaxID=3040156 RepID=A0AAV9GRT4_9PEZI|nr:aspartic peptidase domain-containing protein [Podospora aff. communis PSN243]
MRLPYLAAAVFCDVLLSFAPTVAASDSGPGSAVWIPSSNNWYGIDGNWSSFRAMVGVGGQEVYLSVATALSEIWVVQNHGCPAVPLCLTARGGVFDTSQSRNWNALGAYQLGLNFTNMGGNGDYGLDMISFYDPRTQSNNQYDKTLIAAINETDYYQGFIGVGVNHGRFKNNLTLPFISQMAQAYGTIPSHSYGYTAGAYYRPAGSSSARGTPASLVFGGFDKTRFEPHDTTFALDPTHRAPRVRLRGITADVTSSDKVINGNWTSTSQSLVAMNDSITAMIDTSTPYLWLPTEVCDRFAAALNLTWREDLGVYLYSDVNLYNRFREEQSLSFTFTVSSFDNSDDYGRPFDMPGVINITLPSAAFAQVLRYPFKDAIKFGEGAVPYFPLKRSTLEVNNNQYIIGRAFMQEAYIITKYDTSTFSLHQAKFPENAISSYDLESIPRPYGSIFPEYNPPDGSSHGGLGPGQTAGIVLSAFACGSIIAFVLWCCCRKRKRKAATPVEVTEEDKDDTQSIDTLPKSPVKRMFTMIIGRKRSKKPAAHEMCGNSTQPVEVGADSQHQLFELPVPLEPVELDTNDTADDDTDFAEGSQVLSEYELARRKLERQLQGPVPTYSATLASSPASPTALTSTSEAKSMQDVSPVAHYRPPQEDPSPVSSPTYAGTNSLPDCLPSPLSPHPEWGTRVFDFPSPMTVAPPPVAHLPLRAPSNSNLSNGSSCSPVSPNSPHSPLTFAPSAMTRSDSSNVSPTSPIGSMRLPPTPTCQRTPIDPTRVVCLGPLPENVALPNQQPPPPPIPQIVTPDGRTFRTGRGSPSDMQALRQARQSRGSNDSLGSNFTVEEENRLQEEEVTRQASVRQPPPDNQPRSPRSMERIDPQFELVHVPQVAEKRYSWEEK